jgi:hypothetical protein
MLCGGLLYGLLALLVVVGLQNRLILVILLLSYRSHHGPLLLLLSGYVVLGDVSFLCWFLLLSSGRVKLRVACYS